MVEATVNRNCFLNFFFDVEGRKKLKRDKNSTKHSYHLINFFAMIKYFNF